MERHAKEREKKSAAADVIERNDINSIAAGYLSVILLQFLFMPLLSKSPDLCSGQ
jgi:hypothetical protein